MKGRGRRWSVELHTAAGVGLGIAGALTCLPRCSPGAMVLFVVSGLAGFGLGVLRS